VELMCCRSAKVVCEYCRSAKVVCEYCRSGEERKVSVKVVCGY
jgi:hypothetical protein